jgi:terminase small subunit-like protein
MKAPAKLIVLPRANAPKRGTTGRNKGGRPSIYTEATAVEICRRMVEGESLRSICKAAGMPGLRTMFEWLSGHPEFSQQYARAREAQADAHVEEMLDVARQAKNAKSSEEAQGYRLLVDTLKWRATKMKPKSYGDKLTLDGEVNLRAMSDQEIDSRLAYLIAQAKKPDLRLVEPSEPTPLLPNLGKTPRD